MQIDGPPDPHALKANKQQQRTQDSDMVTVSCYRNWEWVCTVEMGVGVGSVAVILLGWRCWGRGHGGGY